MSDFDFDELDKAVAGVTGGDANNSEVSPVEQQVQKDTPSAPVTLEKPAPVIEEKSLAPKAVPAVRRASGRFMDVVHPSSDMRNRTSPAFINPSQKTETVDLTPPTPAPSAETLSVPDEEKFDDYNITDEWSKPLETPFLPDAKVEKRPLGGFGEPKLALLDEPEEELKLEAPDELRLEESTLPDPIDFAAHLESLVSEEKEDTESIQELKSEGPVEEPVDEPLEQTIEQIEDLKSPEESTPPVLEVVASPEPVGPASITQQYTEKPTTEQESGAIYDTENYHQPLAPVAKKPSSFLTILGIVGLVILGAGAGVAFYFFVLPNF